MTFKLIRNSNRVRISFLIKKLPTNGAKNIVGDNKNNFETLSLEKFKDSFNKNI